MTIHILWSLLWLVRIHKSGTTSGEVDDQDKLKVWAFQCILGGDLWQILIKIVTKSKTAIPAVYSPKHYRYIK